MAATGSASAPHVVIIGAGIGGASCAYYLKKEVPGATVSVIEARDRIGGRAKDVSFFGQTVNVGASVFNTEHRNIAALVKELDLNVVCFPSDGYPNSSVWDGQDIKQTRDLLEQEPAAAAKMQQSLKEYILAFHTNFRKHEQDIFRSVPDFLKAGGLDVYTRQSVSQFFRDTPVSETVQRYTLEPVMRVFFGQGVESSALLAMNCLAGICRNAFRTEGGMSQLVKALIDSSGCNLHLSSRVNLVRNVEGGQLEVVYSRADVDGTLKVTADEVVIAAPLEWTGIRFEGLKSDPSTTQPSRTWQQLFHYSCYVAAKSIRPSYFKRSTSAWSYPLPVHTTSTTTQPWVVIRENGSNQDCVIYNVFSSVDIAKDNLVHDMFDGVQDYISHRWEYVYCTNPPITEESGYQSIVLGDHVYNLNAMESVVTQMEMLVTSGRNVAKLIAKGK